MLLIELIALILVIVGVVVITRGNLWAGVAIIVVGVLVFLLRNQIDSGSNTKALSATALPFFSTKWGKNTESLHQHFTQGSMGP